jgi:hypothetical protein
MLPLQATESKMDRKALLTKILEHLGEAMYLMETTVPMPDDGDEVWFAVNEANSVAEDKLNEILIKEAKQ